MGKVGISVTVSLVVLGNLLLLASMAMKWKHISFFAGAITADTYLLSVRFAGLATSLYTTPVAAHGYSDSDLSGNMTGVRDIFCGIPLCDFCSAMCEKFTVSLACGASSITMFLLTMILSAISCMYLCYHMFAETKREYRLVAYRCLCVAPVTMIVGLFAQWVALFYALMVSPRIANSVYIGSVVTPTYGYFISILSFFMLCSAPCLNMMWVMPTKEIIDDEERRLRRENRDALYDSNPFDYGATDNDSRAFYTPAKFGSQTYFKCDDGAMENNHNDSNDLYPHLVEPYHTVPEPHHQITAQVYTPFACAPPTDLPPMTVHYADRSRPQSDYDSDDAPECPPGYDELPPGVFPPGYDGLPPGVFPPEYDEVSPHHIY